MTALKCDCQWLVRMTDLLSRVAAIEQDTRVELGGIHSLKGQLGLLHGKQKFHLKTKYCNIDN